MPASPGHRTGTKGQQGPDGKPVTAARSRPGQQPVPGHSQARRSLSLGLAGELAQPVTQLGALQLQLQDLGFQFQDPANAGQLLPNMGRVIFDD